MNYLKIYDAIMISAKTKNRQKGMGVYYENHHIVPDFMFSTRKRSGPRGHVVGNPNDESNLVLLTPREHILAYILLARGLTGKQYWASAASALMFFFTKSTGNHMRQTSGFVAGMTKRYAQYREVGIRGISAARMGKLPVKDFATGEMIGSISSDHPNVVSGKWIHHAVGIKRTPEQLAARPSRAGTANTNYKPMTSEHRTRLFNIMPLAVVENHLIIKLLEQCIKEEFKEFGKISRRWLQANFASYQHMVDDYNAATGNSIEFSKYFRGTAHRTGSAAHNSQLRWITDGVINKRLNQNQLSTMPPTFKLGKTKC